jgi:hypothetical protein
MGCLLVRVVSRWCPGSAVWLEWTTPSITSPVRSAAPPSSSPSSRTGRPCAPAARRSAGGSPPPIPSSRRPRSAGGSGPRCKPANHAACTFRSSPLGTPPALLAARIAAADHRAHAVERHERLQFAATLQCLKATCRICQSGHPSASSGSTQSGREARMSGGSPEVGLEMALFTVCQEFPRGKRAGCTNGVSPKRRKLLDLRTASGPLGHR